MNPVVTSVVVGVIVLAALFVLLRTIGPRDEPSPRRRELNRARLDLRRAQLVLYEVRSVVNAYRPVVTDVVGTALLDDVEARLTEYDRQRIEEKE